MNWDGPNVAAKLSLVPIASRKCGGCAGLGAHWRWCPVAVGKSASYWGQLSVAIDVLADTVGSNDPESANYLYAASGRLRTKADRRAAAHKASLEQLADP